MTNDAIMPPLAHRRTGDPWRKAYGFAVANAALFVALSAIDTALSVSSVPWQAGVAALFCVGSAIAFVRMIRTGGGLPFVAFFVLGSGVTFGFGAAYATVVETSDFQAFFPVWAQGDDLRNINLLNSISVLIVLLTAWPFCNVAGPSQGGGEPIARLLDAMRRFQIPLLAASVAVLALEAATFPGADNLLVAGALRAVSPLPLIAVVLTFARMDKSGPGQLATAAAMTCAAAAMGVLRESKTDAVLPMVALAAGLWLNKRSRAAAVAVVLACLVAYVVVLAPLNVAARRRAIPAGGVTGLADAAQFLSDGWNDLNQPRMGGSHDDPPFFARFSDAPFQAFMIDQYREGRPGDSLQNAWAAAVPRVFWPDKPDVTRFGRELYGLVNNTADPHSALAPTYTAEAYWNGGWFAEILVSLLVGLELGWLTRKWLRLTRGRSQDVGVLILAIPACLLAFWVESWIAAAYIGGFLTLAVLISAVDMVTKTARNPVERRLRRNAGPAEIGALR